MTDRTRHTTCTGTATCPSITDIGGGRWLIVGAIAGGGDVHHAGAGVGIGEQAVIVPSPLVQAVIDEATQELRDRNDELEAEREQYIPRLSDYRYYLAELRSYIRHLERAHNDTDVDALRSKHVSPDELRNYLYAAADWTQHRQDGAQEPLSRPPAALAGPAQETTARDAQGPA